MGQKDNTNSIGSNKRYYQIFFCKVTFSEIFSKGKPSTRFIHSCFRSSTPVITPYGRTKDVTFDNEKIKEFISKSLKIKNKIEIKNISVINYLGNSV